jgi:hypothetical protein
VERGKEGREEMEEAQEVDLDIQHWILIITSSSNIKTTHMGNLQEHSMAQVC